MHICCAEQLFSQRRGIIMRCQQGGIHELGGARRQ